MINFLIGVNLILFVFLSSGTEVNAEYILLILFMLITIIGAVIISNGWVKDLVEVFNCINSKPVIVGYGNIVDKLVIK